MRRAELPVGIEADMRLIKFRTYEAYLSSLLSAKDIVNLQSCDTGEQIMALGYVTSGYMTEKEFNERLYKVSIFYHSKQDFVKIRASGISNFRDQILESLSYREEANINGRLLTILYLRYLNNCGHEISAYIDFKHRLCSENWRPIFLGICPLMPCNKDMSFYYWKSGRVVTNETPNFAVTSIGSEVAFVCKRDRKKIYPNKECGLNSFRTEIKTRIYKQAVLYDHIVMKRSDA